MIPREILEQALVDYEKAVEEIQGMGEWGAVEYLEENNMDKGLCYYLDVKFDVDEIALVLAPSTGYLGGTRVIEYWWGESIPTLTARLQLRINKLKELLEK